MKKYTIKKTTEFILDQAGWHDSDIRITAHEFQQRIVKRALFLNRIWELGIFIPTDREGNVLDYPMKLEYGLDRPEFNSKNPKPQEQYKFDLDQYQKAKDRVLFEGYEIRYYSESDIKEDSLDCEAVLWNPITKDYVARLVNGVWKLNFIDGRQRTIDELQKSTELTKAGAIVSGWI